MTTQYTRALAEARQGQAGDPITFIASTPGVKRDGLDLRASGWRLDTFRQNPVFQWAHSPTAPPLGRVTPVAAEVLRSEVLFDQEDTFARQIESKYRRGFLNAVSVSWNFVDRDGQPIIGWRMSVEQLRDEAFYDMTELSGVPVPADPDALMERQRSALRHLGRELVDLFDEQEHPDGEVDAATLRAAVAAELERLGIQLPTTPPEPTAPGVDQTAARALLAAFSPKEGN